MHSPTQTTHAPRSLRMAERDDCFLKHFRPKPVNLTLKDKISDGGVFGEVFSGVYNEKNVAVKKISALFLEYSDNSKKSLDSTIDIFKKELRACKSISYPYICEVLGVFYDAVIREPLLVVEAVKEDLKTFLSRNKGKLSVPEQLVLSLQLTTAVRFLHLSNPGDLFHYLSDKSVFLGDKEVVKLLDCKQSSIEVKEPSLKNPDLIPFLPPEVLSTESRYTRGGDIYSLGVLLLEIAVQKTPFSTTTDTKAESSTEPNGREQDLALVPESHPLKKIILLCLEDKPSRRPDIIKVHSEMSLRVEGQNSVSIQMYCTIRVVEVMSQKANRLKYSPYFVDLLYNKNHPFYVPVSSVSSDFELRNLCNKDTIMCPGVIP